MSDHEEWRPVKGYPGYDVSNMGRARSWRTRNGKPSDTPRLLTIAHRKKQSQVSFRGKAFLIHRVVLETFVGPCPEGMECAHADGDHRNNRLDNLSWKTHRENEMDKERHGTRIRGERWGEIMRRRSYRGERVYNAKLTDEQREYIKKNPDNLPVPTLAELFGVNRTTAYRIRRAS